MDLTPQLENARSLLFVPGNRPDRITKALAGGADAVVLDLEDSVPEEHKSAARHLIAKELHRRRNRVAPVIVRINAVNTFAGHSDLEWLSQSAEPDGVMLSKCESAQQLEQVRERAPGIPLLPLIESAAGFVNLAEIAAADGVLRLVIGNIDFTLDTGIRCSQDERELSPLRFQVAVQTRVHRLAPPVDGVTVAFDDDARLAVDTARALSFGFGAKLCIHPRQVDVVHHALAPSPQELDWARRVIAASDSVGGAAVQVDGQMIDIPVVLKARATVARGAR